jgi:hypothetical protein
MINTSTFIIDFSNIVQQLLPPRLRKKAEIAWLTSLTEPLQNNNDLFLEYINGSSVSPFDALVTYVAGDRVVYVDRSVYISIAGSTGTLPTDSTAWTLENSNYIGAIERSKYNSQKYLNEYALNRWFQVPGTTTTSLYGPSYNNIYIQINVAVSDSFVMGNDGPDSSDMFNRSSTGFMFNSYLIPTSSEFTIFVPSTITTDLQSVRAFEDTVVIAGIQYDVQNY